MQQINYRKAYDMFACNGILFNHESPIRGETFVTRKITRAVAKISLGLQDCLYLGNLDTQRDWGHAKDYVEAMWLMLQQDTPEDFVIATGRTTTIRALVIMAFREVGIEIVFKESGIDEIGVVIHVEGNQSVDKGDIIVRIDSNYFRPTEVDLLIGDPNKALEKLGWKPKYSLEEMVIEMVKSDMEILNK